MKQINNKAGAIIIEGHVQGLSNVRSLGEKGIPVYVVDKKNCIARYSKYCNKYFKCPDYNKEEFIDFLINLAQVEKINDWVLIPSNDHAVYNLAKNKNTLQKHFKLITPDLEVVEKIYDKYKLIKIAVENRIPVPVTQVFNSPKEPVNPKLIFPLLTKGRNGLSFYKAIGKKALLAKNEAELRTQLDIIDKKYIVSNSFTQELIPFDGNNKTISFTAFSVNGEIKSCWAGIKLREHPLRFGTATFTKSVNHKICFEQSEKLLKALNYTGVCEIEYIKDPISNEYKLIEINARTWLWVGLAKSSGVDYAKMIYDYVNETNVDFTYPDDITRYWINPITDAVYSTIAIFKGNLNILNYLVSLFKKNKTNALFIKDDIKPGLFYIFNIFGFLNNR